MFVYVVLKDKKKGEWLDLTISSDDGSQTTIIAAAKKRISQDEAFGYLGYTIRSPLMHLTSGELIRIILADSYWPMFRSHFPASKEMVRTKLEEIGNVRNALAHFRPIKKDDVAVVKQNANQVLSKVELYLGSLIDSDQTVPTNSQEPWYNELKVLSGPYCNVAFRQSPDEYWITMAVNYKCPTTSGGYKGSTYRTYSVLSINTPRVLQGTPVLKDNVVFVSEYVYHGKIGEDDELQISKSVYFHFTLGTLRSKFQELKADFEKLLLTITNETELILEDNLAQGSLVKLVTLRANYQSEHWSIENDSLVSPQGENDPSEFWGSKPLWGRDFVTDTENFPWMPVNIAEPAFPF